MAYLVAAMASPDRVVLTVDVVITDDHDRVLLMQRGTEPYKGSWVLPGGIVEAGETVEQAAIREAKEEVGLDLLVVGIIGVYSTPGRDPRGSFVSIAFNAQVVGGELTRTDEARAFRWVSPTEIVVMGFDHEQILKDFRGQRA